MSKKRNQSGKHQLHLPKQPIYEHPIVSREEILAFLKSGKPKTYTQIATRFKLKEPRFREALTRRLRAMVRDGQLEYDLQDRYFLTQRQNLIETTVVFDAEGRACINHQQSQIWITKRQQPWLLPGDIVTVKLEKSAHSRYMTAVVVDVLAHHIQTVIGRFTLDAIYGAMVVAEDVRMSQPFLVEEKGAGDAKPGQLVVLQIVTYPTRYTAPSGRVIQIIGDKLPASAIIDDMIALHQLPHEWPDAVNKAITHYQSEFINEADIGSRQDLRELPLITIDGADAKDFDDAVYAEKHPDGGWRLMVAIADVSHYVHRQTALDQEAYQRGTSVYFPNRVVPMLPEILSNGLCSLKPDVDRLCLVCDMHIDAQGERKHFEFYSAVIHSHARLTYRQVEDYLRRREALPVSIDRQMPVKNSIDQLQALAKQCLSARDKRGALEFNVPESQIQLDDAGYVTQVTTYQRYFAHQLIEECMLLANTAAAEWFQQQEVASLYRIHEGLKSGAAETLEKFLAIRGLHLPNAHDPQPVHINRMMQAASQLPEYAVIQMMILRSLTCASYSADNQGHFGLAYEAYTHFTSPIRRYPDLVVHRTIKALLNPQDTSGWQYDDTTLHDLAEHTSLCERRAEEASRDAIGMLKCVYMEDKLGEEYAGVISGVLNFGFFVTIDDLLVDGLVHVSTLDNDYYRFDDATQSLIGERTGQSFQLGQAVTIRVAQVRPAERKIDFSLV